MPNLTGFLRPILRTPSWYESITPGFRVPLILWYLVMVIGGSLFNVWLLPNTDHVVAFLVGSLFFFTAFLWLLQIPKPAALAYMLISLVWIVWISTQGLTLLLPYLLPQNP